MKSISNRINGNLAFTLEESEAIYWSKLYDSRGPLKCYARIISGAFAGAIPEVDMLAMNRVIGLGMEKEIKPEDIDNIISFFHNVGTKRFFIQVSPNIIQDDLKEILKEKGFWHYNNWAKLWRKADTILPKVKSELEVTGVRQSQAEVYGQIICASFDWMEPRMVPWLAASVGKPGYQHYFALHQGQPVSAAALHISGEYASMALAGTLPGYRGLGAQSLLLKTRITEAQRKGCQYIISETAEDKPDRPVTSYHNMKRFGFENVYLRENWILEL
jgi:GNAT superfamily N-acetyltransferase